MRLLNPNKSRRKMLTLRFRRRNGQISIQDSTVTSSFFFENNRDRTEASSDRIDIMKSMESDYVGFWIMYRYRNVRIGSQLRLSTEDMKSQKLQYLDVLMFLTNVNRMQVNFVSA